MGIACGLAVNAVMRRLHEANAITVLSFLAAYGAYLLAEEVHASGVLAVVACGLMMGGREHETFDAQARRHSVAVWEFVVFVLEALVFVLIGLALRGVLARTGGEFGAALGEPAAGTRRHGDLRGRPPALGVPRRLPAAHPLGAGAGAGAAAEPGGAADHRLGRHARGRDPGGRPGAAGQISRAATRS